MTTDPRAHNAAIEAAAEKARIHMLGRNKERSDRLVNAILALRLPEDSQPVPAEGVRALVWDDYTGSSQAGGVFGAWECYETTPNAWNCIRTNPSAARLATKVSLEAAKEAAQSDYESFILSALTTSGPSAAECDVDLIEQCISDVLDEGGTIRAAAEYVAKSLASDKGAT